MLAVAMAMDAHCQAALRRLDDLARRFDRLEEQNRQSAQGPGLRGRHPTGAALKVMHPELSQDPAFVDRFKQEIGTLYKLGGHKHLVEIHGFGYAPDEAPPLSKSWCAVSAAWAASWYAASQPFWPKSDPCQRTRLSTTSSIRPSLDSANVLSSSRAARLRSRYASTSAAPAHLGIRRQSRPAKGGPRRLLLLQLVRGRLADIEVVVP